MPGPWGRMVENISSKLAFFPPTPPMYKVKEHKDGSGDLYISPTVPDLPRVLQCEVKKLTTKPTKGGEGGNSEIVTVFVPYKAGGPNQRAKLTFLYSHGNAVDLGQMVLVYRELSRLLKVNVMGYDYTGYGASSGTPSVGHTLADIRSVYDSLVNNYEVDPRSIILYGQSVGTGPSCYLGSKVPNLAGVILHSPLMSGMRVLSPGVWWWPTWADVFPNHTLVPKIKSPVLIMHGTEDEVIHISCAQKLSELCKNTRALTTLWAEGYNHQNLESCPEYIPTLNKFLQQATTFLENSDAASAQSGQSDNVAKASY